MVPSSPTFELRPRRQSLEDAMANAAMATLRQADALAHAGDHQQARELCATVMFELQPLLRRRQVLLRALICALLSSHGFKLVSRLIRAVSGHYVQFVLRSDVEGPLFPPICEDASIYTFDPRWLARLTPDDTFIRDLCDALTDSRNVPVSDNAIPVAPLSAEPV